MGGMLRRAAVTAGALSIISVPAWAATTELEVQGGDRVWACASWSTPAGPYDEGDPFTDEALCAFVDDDRTATLARHEEWGRYHRNECVWHEDAWTHPETGETWTFPAPSCETVEVRTGDMEPGTLSADDGGHRVHGEVAGCEADFAVPRVDMEPPPWGEGDEPTWRLPVSVYGRASGEWWWTPITGSACGGDLAVAGAWGGAGKEHFTRGVAVETP